MSNDAYSQSGLYSHHNSSVSENIGPKYNPKNVENWKKKKGSSFEYPTTSNAEHLPHKKATFSRNNSNGSNASSYSYPRFLDQSESSGDSFKSAASQPIESSNCSNNSSNISSHSFTNKYDQNVSSEAKKNKFIRSSGRSEMANTTNIGATLPNFERSDPSIPLDDTSAKLLTADDGSSPSTSQNSNKYYPQCESNLSSPSEFIVEESVFRHQPISEAVSPTPTATTNNIEADNSNTLECGLLNFRPPFMQKFASINLFVLFLSLLVTVQQAVASGYLNSVITTLEKRYEVPSYVTGLISSMYEIGNVSTVIFVSYLGSSRHIPVWIAVGCVVMGTGSLLFVGPQIMLERWSVDGNNGNSSSSLSICTAATVHHQPIDKLPELGFPKLQGLGGSQTGSVGCPPDEAAPGLVTPVLLFMAGQLLLGAGGSPLLTLGTTYIDDHVARQDSSLYIGIIYTMGAFGPVLGFLLGGYLLSFYVDTFFVADKMIQIDRTHPRWIGMWWAGFLIGSVALLILSVPFLMFPKRLSKEKEKVKLAQKKSSENVKGHKRSKSETSTCSKQSRTSLASRRMYGKDVRDIPACLFKLLLNPIYFMTTLAACMELIIVSGFIVFLPKYLETQFSLSNVQASVFTGGIAIPGACVGTFLGGYILKRFSLRPKGALQMVMICNFIGLCLYALFFVLGCENVKMAGATSPYFTRTSDGKLSSSIKNLSPTPAPMSLSTSSAIMSVISSDTLPKFMNGGQNNQHAFNSESSSIYSSTTNENDHLGGASSAQRSFSVNLTSWCNTGCECSHRLAEPVCGNNGLTYFSPCHAGCTSASVSSFSNCTCIATSSSPDSLKRGGASFAEVVAVPVATKGPCYIPCNTFLPFMAVLFLMCTSVAISQMPLLMIVLRSVSEEERALALGLQFVLFRLIAYIPAPIMFGTVIDSTCLMWTSVCGGGRCLMYDIEQFRFRYVGICASIKLIAAAIFLFDWLLIRWQYKLDMAGTLTVGDIVNSLRSVDRGGEEDQDDFLSIGVPTRSSFTQPHPSSSLQHYQGYHYSPGGSYKPVFPPGSPLTNKSVNAIKLGHKRSQSGCPSGSVPWFGAGNAAGCDAPGHKRSHSSSSPPPGILSNLPGHVRRPSAGHQVTFRDAQQMLVGGSSQATPADHNLNHQYESLLSGDGDAADNLDDSIAWRNTEDVEKIDVEVQSSLSRQTQ